MLIDLTKKNATAMARALSERLRATAGVDIGHQTAMNALGAAFGYDNPNAFAAALKAGNGQAAAGLRQTCCPVCGSTDLERRRDGFLESGPYLDKEGEYEEEFDVAGYRCRSCQEEFFLSKNTKTTVPGESIEADQPDSDLGPGHGRWLDGLDTASETPIEDYKPYTPYFKEGLSPHEAVSRHRWLLGVRAELADGDVGLAGYLPYYLDGKTPAEAVQLHRMNDTLRGGDKFDGDKFDDDADDTPNTDPRGITDPARCDNCGHIEDVDNLNEVKRLFERVDAGGPMPDGECPRCGCLSYAMKPDEIAAEIRKLDAKR